MTNRTNSPAFTGSPTSAGAGVPAAGSPGMGCDRAAEANGNGGGRLRTRLQIVYAV